MHPRSAAPFLVLLALAVPATAFAERPSLVVLVVVDQLGSDLMHRWGDLTQGGIARLMRRGSYFPYAIHDHPGTATGPGHATIVTGAWPNVHGIFTNDWRDPKDGHPVFCLGDPGQPPTPKMLLAPNLADQLLAVTRGNSKAVSIAIKDRVAVLMAGQHPNLAAWYDKKLGAFTTGTWYGQARPPEWLQRFNLERNAAQSFGQVWERLRPDLDYAKLAGPDDRPYEADINGLGRTFPHRYGVGLDGPDPSWFDSYSVTPALLTSLLEVVKLAIAEEQLGQSGGPDLLMIGISSLDYAGHYWGPFAQESLDVFLRIDQGLGELMTWVDRRLGGGRVTWVLTGDHGVVPAPESLAELGLPAERINLEALRKVVNPALAELRDPRKPATTLAWLDAPMLFLGHEDPTADRKKLRQRAAEALRWHPAMLEVYPVEEVDRFGEPFRTMYRRIVVPGREPDLFYRGRAYDLIEAKYMTGTSHGSAYGYDTRVPVMLLGPGVSGRGDLRPYPVTAIAPTIAALLGFTPPPASREAPLPVVH